MSQAKNDLTDDALHTAKQHRATPSESHNLDAPDTSSPQLDTAGSRPKTAPSTSQHQQRAISLPLSVADGPPSSPFSIPRIAIFKDFSLQSLRARASIRKPTTSSDLSDGAKRYRRLSSTSTSTSSTRQQPRTSSPNHPQPPYPHSPEPLKPPNSRPPASHSCNGIETAFGPPPALVTRAASYNSDLSRRAQSPAAQTLLLQKNKPYSIKIPAKDHALEKKDSFLQCTSPEPIDAASSPLSPKLPTSVSPHSLAGMMDRASARNRNNGYLDDGASAYTDGLSPTADGASGGEQEDSGRSAEDLFLNLAEDSPADSRVYDSQSRLERRLVCLLLMFHTHHTPPADTISIPKTAC
jgi:hypothetical protein